MKRAVDIDTLPTGWEPLVQPGEARARLAVTSDVHRASVRLRPKVCAENSSWVGCHSFSLVRVRRDPLLRVASTGHPSPNRWCRNSSLVGCYSVSLVHVRPNPLSRVTSTGHLSAPEDIGLTAPAHSGICGWQVKDPVQVAVDEVVVDEADQIPLVNYAVDELGCRRVLAVEPGPLCLPQLECLIL